MYPKPVAEIQGVGAGHLEGVGTPNHSEQKLLHLELAIHIRAVVVDEVDPGWFAGSGLICSLLEILRETSLNEASEPGEFHLDLNDRYAHFVRVCHLGCWNPGWRRIPLLVP